MITDYLLLAGGIAAAYYFLKPQKKVETTQDLVKYKTIHPDGIIELDNLKLRLVIEVDPINMVLRSVEEQAAIWLEYRNLLNTIHLPFTELIQTRYMNLKDYGEHLKTFEYANDRITNYRGRIIDYLTQKSESKMLRDKKYYLILKIDAYASGVESGIQIDSPVLNSALETLSNLSKTKQNTNDLRKMAIDELNELSAIIRGTFDGLGISSRQLTQPQVLDLIYQTFNRDIASHATVKEANEAEVYSTFVKSLTPQYYAENLD